MKPRLCVHLRNCGRSNSTLWLLLACVVLIGASGTILRAQAHPSSPSNNSAAFAGSREGTCQDGKPFVLLTLRPTTDDIEGTISLGNVNLGNSPENKGGTCTTTDPASPGHSMPIKHALVDGQKLTLEFLEACRSK